MNPAALFLFLVVILLFVSVSWGWYFYLKIRNKERMALIEKDKDVSEIYARPKTKSGFHFPWLKVGIISTGFSIGFIVVEIIMQVFFVNQNGQYTRGGDSIGIGILFLFTSVSILLAYFADKPKNKE
jgi:hypothetical protein